MAARSSRWLFLPLAIILILYIRNLLGQTHGGGKVVEANIRVKIDTPGVLALLESKLDSFTSPIAVDSNGEPIEGRLPSPVVASEPLTFDPPSLDFEEQSVGMTKLITVKVLNPSKTHNLHLNSISGESHVFHPSFFKSKVVKAGGKEWTTFDVVFLPRVSGPIHDTLFIHTSHGTFEFKVQGVGVPNPFRMRPLLGARIPLNATYSPLITMYNPFETTLQVTEMYSSGGDLHLELLSGQLQGSKSLWEIRPYETKPIARANFVGRAAVNHTSFIRVKTSLEQNPSIILPVEVEVSENHGLYLSRELLDFGILKSGETKSLPLFVLNTGPHTVHIKSISAVPDNPSIDIEPTTTFLKLGSKYLKIASVTLTPILGAPKEEQSGHLEIVTGDDQGSEYRLRVPYDSTILQGTLAFEKSQTMFRVGRPPFQPLIRNISLANHFKVPLVLYDIRLSSKAQDYFTVLDFRSPFTLPPTAEWHRPFALQFQGSSSDCLFNTTLRVSTNASLFNIPFFCYDGRVTYTLNSTENPNNEDVLDYEILSESDSVSKHFFLVNPNPIRITIVSFLVSDSIPFTTVELLQIEPADMSVDGAGDRVQIIGKKQGAKGPFYVEPDMVGVFRVNVTNPKKLGTFTGEILIHTSFDRVLRVPVYYKTAVGSVKIIPDKNIFEPNFPYGIQKLPLLAKSYYPQTLDIREVHVDPPDDRFYFITERTERIPHLKPQSLTELGKLVFDPLRGDSNSIYLGTSKTWSVAKYGNQLDAKADRKEFSMLWDVWSSLQDDALTQFNFSFVISTEIDTTIPVPAEASLIWPTLYPQKQLQFPTTSIGNTSVQTLKLANPSRHPIVVQPVLLHYYPQQKKINEILYEIGSIESIDFTRSESSFSLDPDHWGSETALPSHTLSPGSEIELKVKFTAHDSRLSSSLLILRNNLTALEYVVVQGKGLEGQFNIDGVHPDTTSLLFQFTPSDLEKCTEGSMLSDPLKLTKVFRMHNAGPSPMKIKHIGLGEGRACEGNGFILSNCGKEIVILSNKTKKLELSLIPDFTLSRVENTLTIETANGLPMTFPLAVLIPHNMLASCYAVQPHPLWEERLCFFSTPVWLAILFCVTMVALVQTNCGIISPGNDGGLPTVQPTGGTYFDFGDITKVLHNTLLEKLESLKKGVNAAQAQDQTRKPPDKHPTHKHQKPSPPQPPTPLHPSPSTTTGSKPRDTENTSEVRRRSTQEQQLDTRVTGKMEDGSTKDTKRLDSGTILSQGSSRKSERNRYTMESVNKPVEEVVKPGVCSQPQHHITTSGSLIASDGGDGSKTHTSHGTTSKSTFSDHHPPVMTTDQETGMRKFVEQPSPTEQGPIVQESTSKSKKPTKLSVASSESYSSIPSTPTEGRSTTSSSSSSAAPTPVQQRKEHEKKGKGLRKSSTNKLQKASPVLNSSTAKQTHRGGASVQPTLQQASPPSPQVVKEHLERKESESSLRSMDSESTSSTSDKSEKEENATSPGENPEIDSNPPLAKEPGTGQTIPLLLAQEEFLLQKAKLSPPESVAATSLLEDGEGKREEGEKDGVVHVHVQEREVEKKEKLPLLPTPRPRSKKKLRQQQRKEDKLRRKEREREKVREREEGEKRKEQNVESEMKQTAESPELQLTSPLEETTENMNMAPSSVAEERKPSKVVATSPKKAKKVELKTHSKSAKLPSRSRTAPAHVTVPPTPPPLSISPSLPAQPPHQDEPEERSDSPEVEQLAQTWPATELEDFKESPESLSPSSQPELTFSRENSEDGSSVTDQSDSVLQSSHPMEAIPMSALRAMRAKGSKQRKVEEEGSGAPTTSPKKNITTARRTKEVEKTSTRSTDKSSTSNQSHTLQVEPRKKKYLSADDTSTTDSTPSPEPTKVIENELLIKSKSPHEIAAKLLSKNPAIKKRKVKTDPEQEGSDEGDDMKYEKHMSEDEPSGKVLWAADGDKHQMGLMRHYKAPTTLSLDAEPFYPSSDYVPRVKPYKKYHHPDTPYAHGSHLSIPSGFSSSSPAEESGVYFERKSRVREIRPPHHLSLRSTQLRHHGNTLTPSPPPYVMSTDTYYSERHGGIEPSELSRYPHISPDVSPYDIQHDEFYSPSVSGRHIGVEGLPGPRSRMSRSSTLYDDQLYSSPQQHEAAVYAAAQRRERHGHLSSTGSLWDQHQLMQDEEAALLRRQQQLILARKLREEQLVKMHARRSAETLSTLNYPQPHLARSTVYPDATSPWEEDAYLSAHQVDDTFLTEPMHPHAIRQPRQQLLQEHMSQMASYPRRRRYSSDNEVGGEFLPDLLQTPSSPGPISSSTGLNKAPGTAFSGMAQARAAAVSGREHDILSDNRSENKRDSTWPNATWSLDSPFNSSSDRGGATSKHVVGFPGRDQHHSVSSERQSGGPQSSFLENTYDLFRDKSIWGIGTETPSANILPWAQLKSTELPPTDPK